MLEGYITPLLMSYISKYVKNIQPSDLKLSFWGGDAVLRNLELRLDVLERELQWPIEIKSGRIRELTLHIPWSAILSTPVEVAIKDIEFVIKLKDMRLRSSQNGSRPDAPQPAPRENPAAADAASSGAQSSGDGAGGGGQGYLSRISNNVIFHVQNLVIKVIEEECDLMLTLNIPAVEVFTADESWTRVFVYTDYFQGDYDLHGVWDIKDMIVNLQQIDSSGQVQDSSEPFVQRCSFSCRMKSTYRGGVYVHHATNVLWERIEFSCDENQFCLFLHLLDWLLAIYYQSKRLRGRDDKSKGTGDCEEVDKPSVVTTELSAGVHESLQSYVVIPEGQVGDPKVQKPPVASTSKPEGPPQDQGWGSWAWSFVSSPTSNDQSRSSTESGTATPAPDVVPSSSFAMFAKSASIDIKVTHQIQIPVFYSVKSFTRSILSVNFIGALFQLDRDPATQLFLVSMGAMSISADITGLCSCVQKPPSSWRAVTDQIPVFSFGEEDSTHDPNIVVRDSLFDESADQKPGQQQQQPAIPPPNPLELLDSREKVFTAGWLTYEYYDVGPTRETEECTVVVQFGRGEITLSPDVVHRLQHYYRAFSQSLEANPVFSEGMVVIGDPKAETIVKVRLASGRAVVTPNTHYIPASDTRHQSLKSSNKTPRRVASSKLPVLCFAIARSSVHITYPMYTGNASEETPQKYHLRAEICGVTGSDLDSQGIHFQEEDFANLEQFLHVPNLEVSHHSKTIGIEETQTSYLQLDVEEGSLALSLLRISKLLSITGSWRGESIPRSTLAQIPSTSTPTGGESGQGHLLLSVKNLTVTQSISEEFSLLSAVLGEGNGSLVKDTPDKQLLPFFHGPLDTQQWNTVCAFQELKSQPRSVSCSEERLVELFVATPHQKLKNERFPAFQLSISGFALSLDPSLLAFTKLVSLKSYHTPFGRELHLEEVGSPEAASGGIAGLQPGGLPLPYTATSPTPTCSTDVPVATHPSETKDSLMTTLKHYAAKIKINPVLLILPNETHIAAGATEDVISPIPVLPALAASLAHSQSSEGPSSNSPTAAVILCLPQVRLESAKSHVLDEPVPRNSRPDTLPWDCTLSQLSLFTIAGRRSYYLLEPATVKASLAAQQEGTGVTVHVDTLAVSVSESQVALVSGAITALTDSLAPPCSSPPTHEQAEDSGIVSTSGQTPPDYPPSLLSSPAHSTVTITTLPTVTESTVSSLALYPGFSSLWVQIIISKLSVSLYTTEIQHSEPANTPAISSTYTTPLTSPLGSCTSTPEKGRLTCSHETKLLVEADSISLQLDSQEKSTDVVLKVTALECGYFKKEEERWVPFLASEKLFSSSSSTLPADLSQAIARSVSHIVPQVHLPMQSAPSPKLHRSFVLFEAKFPKTQLHKAPKMRVSVHSFELVVWLPALSATQRLLSAIVQSPGASSTHSKSPTDPVPAATARWPAVEVSVESFRLVFPSVEYTSTVLLSLGALHVTSTLDYPGPDTRFIVNSSAFRKLSLLSSEKKQPPLPAYQLDAIALSLWGLRSGRPFRSPSVLLCASSADLRVLYSPALHWSSVTMATTPGTAGRRAPASDVVACGHCVETNISTDMSLMLGPEQVACICEIVATNTFLQVETQKTKHGDKLAPPPESTISRSDETAIKFLLTGRAVAITLLRDDPTSTCSGLSESGIGQSDLSYGAAVQSAASVTPVLQMLLFNPLCTAQSENGSTKCEVSVFNVAMSYNDEPTLVDYSELLDFQAGCGSSLGIPLLETRRGQSDRVVPSALTITWSSNHCENTSVLCADIERPFRLSLSRPLLRDLSQLLTDTSAAYHRHLGSRGDSGERRPEGGSERRPEGRPEGGSERADKPSSIDWQKAALHTQLKLSSCQVLVEFQLSSVPVQPVSSAVSPLSSVETTSLRLGEAPANCRITRITEEGVLLSWEGMNAAFPHGNSASSSPDATGDLHVTGLQLLTTVGRQTAPVLQPTQLNCVLTYCSPHSELDQPQVAVNLSCGLLQLRLSRTGVDVIEQTAWSFLDLLARGVGQGEPGGEKRGTESEDGGGGGVGGRGTNGVVQFRDDLRRGNFKYTTDDSLTDPPAVPTPGEIVFHLGGPECEATMSWEYREPRAITSLMVLPVPFGVTTQEDAPVDIKVGCTLEYWDEDQTSFVSLEHFHMSESSPSEVTVARPAPSRRWRVSINEVEWVDEEEGELFISKANVTDVSGSLVPLSSILSPVSLAASLRVDSHFSPGFVPTFTLSAHCQELQATLEHRAGSKGHSFLGYSIAKDVTVPQELLRVSVNGLNCRLKQHRDSCIALQVNGSVSADFVDFRDLTWRAALHPAHLRADVHLGRTAVAVGSRDPEHNICEPQARSGSAPLSLSVCCSPAVVRVSQGLLHTSSLALHCWNREEDERRGSQSPIIPNHYVLCNSTAEELHIGQVSTDEDVLLPSNSYIGYSWRSHKAVPQVLHACFVSDGIWRWTEPFSIDTAGLQSVQLYVGKDTADLHVQVTNISGLQKQVTLFGNWQFSSSLSLDLDLQLVYTEEAEHSHPTAAVLSLASGSTLPSLLASDTQMAGVKLRASRGRGETAEEEGVGGRENEWSKVYPLGSSTHKWNKPQLLAEMEAKSGKILHSWYNIKPIHSTTEGAWGNKISFAPLFAVRSHLPFGLELGVSTIGREDPVLSCQIPGKGCTTQLCDLSADVWYNFQYKQSDKTAVSVPPLAVSTYLLVHLPFFLGFDDPSDSGWPYDSSKEVSETADEDESKSTAATTITLPMDGGHTSTILVSFLRSGLNTIVVDLEPESLVINRCPLSITVVEKLDSNERTVELGPGDVTVLAGNELTLNTEWQGKYLSSKPITLPPRKLEKGKSYEPLQVALAEDETPIEKLQIVGDVQAAYSKVDRMLITTIRPSFILQNNLSHPLDLWPCIVSDSSHPEDPLASCLQQVPAKEARAVVFWQGKDSSEAAHALLLRSSIKDSEHGWSIFLSPNFIRHSFALPTGNSKEPFAAALLTVHDYEDITYLVVSHDPSPKLQIQNLGSSTLEVSESGSKAIHVSPQVLPPGCQVAYEPPALAKLYPLVYEEEIVGKREKEVWKAAKDVAIKFRTRLVDSDEEEKIGEWSEPFHLTGDADKIVTIPEAGSMLISIHTRGNAIFISLLPTGSGSPPQREEALPLAVPTLERAIDFKCTLTQAVICLDDETSNQSTITEILRIIADEVEARYLASHREGSKIDLTLQALHVDNMTESSLGEYAVMLIPRSKHAARAKLIHSDPPPLLTVSVHYNPHTSNSIERLYVSLQSITVQVEDTLLHTLKTHFESYTLPGTLNATAPSEHRSEERLLNVPPVVRLEAERDASPVTISSFVIEPIAVHLNARVSLKVLLSCNDSPFSFSRYELQNVYSNWSELSQTVAAHYFSTVIMHVGWLLGSLELIGSPGALIQSIGRGIQDLISLPYEGIVRSPSLFILGIGRGTAACVQHFSSGAIRSVVNLTSSLARNMERLSMDPHHISYQDRQRRERPATHFTTGLATGASSFGLSLVSAVAGIVDQPMQSIHQMEESAGTLGATKTILGGIGKGLLGAVAKPVGGAMDFVSQTGQGIMHGTGLVHKLTHRSVAELEAYTGPVQRSQLSATVTKCVMKIGDNCKLLASIPVTHVTATGSQCPSILLLTTEKFYLFDCKSDRLQQSFPMDSCSITERGSAHMIQLDEVELHVEIRSPEMNTSREEIPEFKPVEHYLQLSSAQELVVSPPSPSEKTTTLSNWEKLEEKPSLVLCARTHQAAQFLLVYNSVVQHMLQPNCSYCVYSSVSVEESFP